MGNEHSAQRGAAPAAPIVVTGGGSGIGAACVERLIARGAHVIVVDRAAPKRDDVNFEHCDLTGLDAIGALVARLPAQLHALINVAGVATTEPAQNTIAVNFLALRELCERLLPSIERGGTIVNVASTAGRRWAEERARIDGMLATRDFAAGLAWLERHKHQWIQEPYRFSKLCAAAYTYRATQLALPHGVRVNCVLPGVVETALSPAFREIVGPQLYDWGVEQIGRPGAPGDIAEVLEFLTLGPCDWLNGVEIVVDGGYIAGIVGGWITPPT
ncbi:MAG: SDR family NAD(P)-dependent oxidoreductase [Pseudomonadota bacterium]